MNKKMIGAIGAIIGIAIGYLFIINILFLLKLLAISACGYLGYKTIIYFFKL